MAERERLRRRILDAANELDDEMRTTVLLRYMDGLPPREIAKRMGIPVETVRSRVRNIREQLRRNDLACRYGGDEFCLMLPESDLAAAWSTAERIRAAVENTSFSAKGKRVSSTISVGVSCYSRTADAKEEIMTRADKKLYESKDRGKNTVTG